MKILKLNFLILVDDLVRAGNLSYEATKESITEHFRTIAGALLCWLLPFLVGEGVSLPLLRCGVMFGHSESIVDIRVLTKKGTNEPRGCAFLEVLDFYALQVQFTRLALDELGVFQLAMSRVTHSFNLIATHRKR
jgi:hypothetical protein